MSQHSDDQGGVGAAAGSPPAAVADRGAAITTGGILTVGGILVLFMVLAFWIFSIHHCLHYIDGRSRGARESPSGRRRRRAAAGTNGTSATRGIDPELLRSLPVTLYRATAAKNDAVECAVCLAELEDGEEARFLPRCGHGFHAECVDTWLASHTTCPLCRLTVAKPDMSPPTHALALRPVPHELANYSYASNNLPASVLLGVSDHHQGAVIATAPSTDRVATATLVIEIPESTCDAAKSPGSASARLRTIRRLWSFGRQGAGASSCAGGSEGADVEQGITVTIGIAIAEAQLPSETAASATRGAAA